MAATRAAAGPGPLRRYEADLVVPREVRAQCALLKGMALRYVMRRRGVEPWYARQREILTELVEALADRAPDGLDPVFAPVWKAAADDAARLRVVIDQVASLTDPAAMAWHRALPRPALRPPVHGGGSRRDRIVPSSPPPAPTLSTRGTASAATHRGVPHAHAPPRTPR